MTTTSERPANQAPANANSKTTTTRTYTTCGEPVNVSSGCGRQLVGDDQKRRGICADFPMC